MENVCDGGTRRYIEIIMIQGVSNDDSAAQDALSCPSVEHSENGWWAMGFPQHLKKVQILLGFVSYGTGVGVPGDSTSEHQWTEHTALGASGLTLEVLL